MGPSAKMADRHGLNVQAVPPGWWAPDLVPGPHRNVSRRTLDPDFGL